MILRRRTAAAAALLSLSVLVGGCAEYEQIRDQAREIRDLWRQLRGREPAPAPPTPPVAAEPGVPARGLTVSASCVERNEAGYSENVRLDVQNGEVRQFDARIDVPKRGSCRFQFADYAQSKRTPYVELLARSNTTCAVRMWEQGDRVTVAATDCPEKCAVGAFEYVWPIELNGRTGACY